MDNLTHTLTGVALSRAGLNRLAPQATWILLLSANVPDVDLVTALGGAARYLDYHRHLTHAVLLIPVMALLAVAIVRLIQRKPLDWLRCWVIAMAGVASHVLLDLTNIYGVRLWLPFSAQWSRLDITHVVDPWIWAVLLVAVAAPALSRLVGSEIGEACRNPYAGAGWAWFALLFVVTYDGARWVLHRRAVDVLESRIYEGEPPRRVAALAHAINPMSWRGLVEGETFFGVYEVDLDREFDPAQGTVFYKAAESEALRRARETDAFQSLLRFAQFGIWTTVPAGEPENATRADLIEMRFGTPRRPGFHSTAVVDARGQVLESRFRFR